MTLVRFWLALAVFAAGCASLAVALYTTPEPVDVATQTSSAPSLEATADDVSDEDRTRNRAIGMYGDALNRPLFVPSRRAPQSVSTTGADVTAADLPFVLLGTMLTGSQAVALVRIEDGTLVRLETGDEIDGWRLEEVRREAIVVKRGETQREMALFEQRQEPPPVKPRQQRKPEKT